MFQSLGRANSCVLNLEKTSNDHPVHISCGGEHTAVITENGRLLVFGGNSCCQLGLGFKPAAIKPASVKAFKSEKVKLAACGKDHTIVCTWWGSVYGAGSNHMGQLGLGHCNNTSSFQPLHQFCDHTPIKMLSAGCHTSAALTGLTSFEWHFNQLFLCKATEPSHHANIMSSLLKPL
uniref:Secretion regulating guanine nucleotide exchange factor n=1 Tax=Sphaeramia orbicularis TaxID=375764 RepID=A0A672ZV66_9TELE